MLIILATTIYFSFFIFLPEKSDAIPIANISANNSDNSLSIEPGNNLIITVSINSGTEKGQKADWWVVVDSPPGWFYYDLNRGWVKNFEVTYQGALEDVSPVAILNYAELPEGSYIFYFGVDFKADGKVTNDSFYYDSVKVEIGSQNTGSAGPDIPCGTKTSLFTKEPLDPESYTEIDPLGNTSPSAHTFPTVHTYMMLTNKQNPAPIYAPGNMIITGAAISKNITLGSTDYTIDFSPCAEVTGYFIHVTTLTDNLLSQIGAMTTCSTSWVGNYQYEFCYTNNLSISVNAGAIWGYAGGINTESGPLILDLEIQGHRLLFMQIQVVL